MTILTARLQGSENKSWALFAALSLIKETLGAPPPPNSSHHGSVFLSIVLEWQADLAE